jgi:hypothetical protein
MPHAPGSTAEDEAWKQERAVEQANTSTYPHLQSITLQQRQTVVVQLTNSFSEMLMQKLQVFVAIASSRSLIAFASNLSFSAICDINVEFSSCKSCTTVFACNRRAFDLVPSMIKWLTYRRIAMWSTLWASWKSILRGKLVLMLRHFEVDLLFPEEMPSVRDFTELTGG